MSKKNLPSAKVNNEIAQKFKRAKNKGVNFSEYFNEFLLNFVSEKTKKSYLKDLQMFFEFVSSGGESIDHPKDIQSYHFSVYRDEMIDHGYAPATINRRLVCIRSFMKWALSKNIIDHNPLDSVKLPKVQTVSPTQAFDDEEVRLMIDAPVKENRLGNTHRLVLILLFHLGLRRGEVNKIKLKDITKERNHTVLNIKGKGQKVRSLPLNNIVLGEIDDYLKRFEKITNLALEDNDYLVQTAKKGKNNSPCDGSTIYRIVSRYAKELGINKNVGAHSCRATVISHLLDTKKSQIRDVAEFAGHNQITTTQRYDKKRKGLDDSAAYLVEYDETA